MALQIADAAAVAGDDVDVIVANVAVDDDDDDYDDGDDFANMSWLKKTKRLTTNSDVAAELYRIPGHHHHQHQ